LALPIIARLQAIQIIQTSRLLQCFRRNRFPVAHHGAPRRSSSALESDENCQDAVGVADISATDDM